MNLGALFLIPTNLADPFVPATILPAGVLARIGTLDHFVVEHAKTARQFLKTVGMQRPLQELTLLELNGHTPPAEIDALLAPLLQGKDCGLLSDAGAPAVADPGASLVAAAHRRSIRVVPLVGPSAILLALMASGLNGQRFAFHGYLPIERIARTAALRELESESARRDMTQLFIETPYRNGAMLGDLLATCDPGTRVCVACNLTGTDEIVVTRSVRDWRSAQLPDLDRKPAMFLLLAARVVKR